MNEATAFRWLLRVVVVLAAIVAIYFLVRALS
jgi:hypothetical protein